MERKISWKSPKIWIVLAVSFLTLIGLLFLAQKVNTPVTFADLNLEKVVRKKIGKPCGPITRTDLMAIIELDASSSDIHRLDGIEAMQRLAVLNLANNMVEDLRPLAELKMLKVLNLSNNGITELDAVYFGHLTHLELRKLDLRGNHIQNIELLQHLTHLEKLHLRGNNVQGIEPLQQLTLLVNLNLRDNHIEDIEPLHVLIHLEKLNLRNNKITDIEPLTQLSSLVYLNIHSNPVNTGLAVLEDLTKLETLIMRNVHIGEEYAFFEKLVNLRRLNIRNSDIADVAVLGKLMEGGALQDNLETGEVATIDLLEIDPSGHSTDPYQELRRYWDSITIRYPFSLPYYASAVKPPQFSHQSGFYEEGFYLSLSSDEPESKIFYTLDGSAPALTVDLQPLGSTREYKQPLFLDNRKDEPNVLSNIKTGTVGVEYNPPSEIFKNNVVRAIVLDHFGNRSDVVTHSFFIDEHMQGRYTLPIVSICTNPDYLFDDEIGIYVRGNKFIDLGDSREKMFYPANFTQRGLKWERPIYFEMFTQQGALLFSKNLGVRIHGGASRALAQKSLRLYAREEHTGDKLIEFDFFPKLSNRIIGHGIKEFATLIMRNGGTEWKETLIRDVLSQSLLIHTNLDIQDWFPVVVFINGEYWGIHHIRNRYDENYFSTYYGIEPQDLVVLDNAIGDLFIGNPGDQESYRDLLQIIDENHTENGYQTVSTLANQNAFKTFINYIDVDNYIIYLATHIYFGNGDWPQNNVILWKKKVDLINSNLDNLDEVPYGHDGKWRWSIIDIDWGMTFPDHNTILHATTENKNLSSTFLFRSLLENDHFVKNFINTFADHLNTTFREEVVEKSVDSFQLLYAPEIKEHIHRWGNLGGSYEAWNENVAEMRKFAQERPTYVRQHVVEYFDLPGVAKLTVQTQPERGFIRINSIEVKEGAVGVENPGDWSGIYFQGVPIQIEAVPYEGYRFVGWGGLGAFTQDITATNIDLTLPGDLSIIALFEEN